MPAIEVSAHPIVVGRSIGHAVLVARHGSPSTVRALSSAAV